jgi:hypothetical protein
MQAMIMIVGLIVLGSGGASADPSLPQTISQENSKCRVEASGGEYPMYVVKKGDTVLFAPESDGVVNALISPSGRFVALSAGEISLLDIAPGRFEWGVVIVDCETGQVKGYRKTRPTVISQWSSDEKGLELSDHLDLGEPDGAPPNIHVTDPEYVYEQVSTRSLCATDMANQEVSSFGGGWQPDHVRLRDGKYEHRPTPEKDGASGWLQVDLEKATCFDARDGKGQRLLVETRWTGGGGSSSSDGVVQVFEQRSGHLAVAQQFFYDSQANGAGVDFDKIAGVLTIRGRKDYDHGHCCPHWLDSVTYAWDGKKFSQRDAKVIPVLKGN